MDARFEGYSNGGGANLSERVDWSVLSGMKFCELIDGEEDDLSSELPFSGDWASSLLDRKDF